MLSAMAVMWTAHRTRWAVTRIDMALVLRVVELIADLSECDMRGYSACPINAGSRAAESLMTFFKSHEHPDCNLARV